MNADIVYVDYREGKSMVIDALRDLKIPIEMRELKIGDYVMGNVAVERKTIGDYFASIKDKRLGSQLYQLSSAYDLSYIIVEGDMYRGLLKSRIHPYAFWSSYVGDSLKRSLDGKQGQVITLNTFTHFETALCIKFIRKKLKSGETRMLLPPKISYKRSDIQLSVLSSIPGIGPDRAKNILKDNETLRNVFTSTDLTGTKGIGDRINSDLQILLDDLYDPEGEKE